MRDSGDRLDHRVALEVYGHNNACEFGRGCPQLALPLSTLEEAIQFFESFEYVSTSPTKIRFSDRGLEYDISGGYEPVIRAVKWVVSQLDPIDSSDERAFTLSTIGYNPDALPLVVILADEGQNLESLTDKIFPCTDLVGCANLPDSSNNPIPIDIYMFVNVMLTVYDSSASYWTEFSGRFTDENKRLFDITCSFRFEPYYLPTRDGGREERCGWDDLVYLWNIPAFSPY